MREGWHRALDVQIGTHKWCQHEDGRRYNALLFGDIIERITDYQADLGFVSATSLSLNDLYMETLWRGDTLFVTSDMMHVLMQAAHDLPEDATFDEHNLITTRAFCMFEEPIVGIDRHGKRICFHGMVWAKELIGNEVERKTGVMIYFLVDPSDPADDYNEGYCELTREIGLPIPPMTLQHFYPAFFGSTIKIPTETVTGTLIVQETLKLFLAMQLIAQQKIGEPMQMRPDRATRRRMGREYGEHERLITLITLRRKSVKKDDEEPQKIEWNRRWVVQGHWRKQWYPKSQTHDYIYIHEYIKGPEDKPLVLSERRVFNFAR